MGYHYDGVVALSISSIVLCVALIAICAVTYIDNKSSIWGPLLKAVIVCSALCLVTIFILTHSLVSTIGFLKSIGYTQKEVIVKKAVVESTEIKWVKSPEEIVVDNSQEEVLAEQK